MLENIDSWLLPSILPWIVSPRSWCQALHVHIQSTNIFRCIFLQCSIMILLKHKVKVHGCNNNILDDVKN